MMRSISGKESKLAQGIILGLTLGIGLGGACVASAENINVTEGTDVSSAAGIIAPSGETTTRIESAQITIAQGISASGIIAKGIGTKLITSFKDDSIVTATGGATAVDGIYVTSGGSVSMTGGTINISATQTAIGVQAGHSSSATITNLGANFKVASTGTGTATGIGAGLGGATVVVSGTDLDKITSADGDVYGMWASLDGKITFTADANNVSKDIVVKSTGSGNATALYAYNGGQNTVTGVEKIDVESTSGEAVGILAEGYPGQTGVVTSNNVTMTGDLIVLGNGTNSSGTGIQATYYGTNTVTGVKNIDVETVNTTKTTGGSTGIIAVNHGTNNVNNGSTSVMGTLTVKTKTAEAGNDTALATGVESLSNGTNNIGGLGDIDVEVTGTGDAVGIYANTSSTNNINTTATSKMGTLTVKTASGNAAGIGAAESSTNTVAGLGAITVNSTGIAYGILAGTSSTNNVNKAGDTGRGDITVTSTERLASGVMAMDGVNTVYGYENITANGATKAYGVNASGTSGVNTIVMNGQVSATGGSGETMGVCAESGGKDIITGVTAISATSAGTGEVDGISADDGTVKVYQADGSSAVPVTATSTGSGPVYGIIANDSSTVTNVSDVTVASVNGDAGGVVLGDGTNTVTALNNIKVNSTSGDVNGIATSGSTGTNTLTVAGNIEATTGDDYSLAYGINNINGQSLTVTVKGNVTTSSLAGEAGIVNSTKSGGTTDVTVQGNMTATGKSAVLAVADSGSTLTLTGGGTATLQATNSAIVANVSEQSIINLKNITAKAEGPADGSNGIVSDDKGGTVNLINTKITGNGANGAADSYYLNVDSAATDNLNINIDKSSSLTGAAIASTDSASLGSININNAGIWNVTGNSNLNASGASSITNTGTIDMSKDGTTSSSQVFSTIKVNSLNNSGNIILDVSTTDSSASDKIIATTASGSGILTANIPAALMDTSYKDYLESDSAPLIKITGSNTSNYTIGNNGNNKLELGKWTYRLQSYTMTDGSTGYRLVNSELLSNKGKTAMNTRLSPDYWYYETNALYSDIDNFTSARTDKDVWAHAVHNKLTTNCDNDFSSGDIDDTYSGVVAGFDKKLSDNAKGTLWAGVMVGYGKGNSDLDGGSVYTDSGHVSLYTVYRSKSDWYMAGILKYNRYGAEIETATNAGTVDSEHSSGKLNQNGYGLSIMGGKRFKVSKGWFVEPQVEFGYHRIGSGEYNLGDEEVAVDAMTSKRLRAGINFGKNLTYKNGSSLDVFAQASLVHEFGGDYTVNISDRAGSEAFDVGCGGSWGLYKVGVNYNAVKGNNAIFALTYNKGGHRSSPLGVELTYNWAF
jgi:outer membrane autotransporter protein